MEKSRKNAQEQADKSFKEGEKLIKTGLLKWSADYLGACSHFEKAGKAYKELGLRDQAVQSYLKFSFCSEKINEFFGAAEGLAEAAQLERDKEKSVKYLKQAQNFFKIQGSSSKGQQELKKFAKKLIDSDIEMQKQLALDIYKGLFEEVFDGDNFLWNPDIVHEYIQLLVNLKEYQRAIDAKKALIKHLRSEGQIDHQMRRAWVEIIMLQILAEDIYKLEDSLQQFLHDSDNCFSDEYSLAESLKNAVDNRQFKEISQICKKPLFGFLENEIVKQLKLMAINPPASLNQQEFQNKPVKEEEKQEILDKMFT